jgi:hypothetical protein
MPADENMFVRGVRMAVRNDSNAFAYSVLVTATFGVVNLWEKPVTTPRIFLFVFGATVAFAAAEAASSRFFRIRLRSESSDVVLIGTAMAPMSVGVSLGAATASTLAGGALAWFLAPATATLCYVVATGTQLAVARLYEQRHPPDRSES